MQVKISPRDFIGLFGGDIGDVFLLAVTPKIRDAIALQSQGPDVVQIILDEPVSGHQTIIKRLQRHRNTSTSILWIGEWEFHHLPDNILEKAKIGAISFFSNGFSIHNLKKILRIIKRTDYLTSDLIGDRLLRILDNATRIDIKSKTFQTRATFHHQTCDHWFSLQGPLGLGQQTVLPVGEVSVLTDPNGQFSFSTPFPLNGELPLIGIPVVHRGSFDVKLMEAKAVFKKMAQMREYPVIASVRDGVIRKIRSGIAGRNPFLGVLTQLFRNDSAYRKIHEIGFGTNEACSPLLNHNFFPNERHPGIHLGLGLGGHTRFHFDLVCPDLDVVFCGPQSSVTLAEIVSSSSTHTQRRTSHLDLTRV